jgi:FkbM family methyltransferase
MQLNFDEIYNNFNHIEKFRGIVHIGAFVGCERDIYQKYDIKPVLWFEADPFTYSRLKMNIQGYEQNFAFNTLLGEEDAEDVPFYITGKNGNIFNNGSSSMLPLGKHMEYHPGIKVIDSIKIPMMKFSTFLQNNKDVNIKDYNMLNIDVQGAELNVIKGMGKHLAQFDYILSEVNEAELYKGGALLDELQAYLQTFGFQMKMKYINDFHYGDAFFVRI